MSVVDAEQALTAVYHESADMLIEAWERHAQAKRDIVAARAALFGMKAALERRGYPVPVRDLPMTEPKSRCPYSPTFSRFPPTPPVPVDPAP